MNKLLILAATAMTIAFAAPAMASDNDTRCTATSGIAMSLEVVRAKAIDMGYDVRKIEKEYGCYELYAIDKDGRRVEIYMNPVTGEIVRTKFKS